MSSRTSVVVLASLAACGRAPAGSPRSPLGNASAAGSVRIAIATDRELRVVEVSARGDRVLRSAHMPTRIDALAWEGDDPVVLLQRGPRDSCDLPEEAYDDHAAYEAAQRDCEVDPKYEGIVGRLTEAGFIAYPPLPESTWSSLEQPKDAPTPCTTGCWSLAVTPTEVWQGHCKWVFSADGSDHCEDWVYARIDKPGPATKKPPATPDTLPLPVIAAPSSVSLSFAAGASPHRDGDDAEPALQLHCAIDGKEVSVYPDVKDLDAGMSRDVSWLATTPPLFAAMHNHTGFEGWSDLVVFESCKPTSYDKLVTGPGGLVALVGQQIEIRQNGVLVGSTAGGKRAVFAPK
ncbi:MAG TPA: hypothetical protein VLB44_25065 [Kofleriaceae bacterium]|nr:hypothetical protein [Kofleriaceae bacterium]